MPRKRQPGTKRRYKGKNESPEVKKPRDEHVNEVEEEQVIEIDHSQLRYVVDETILSILAEAECPMQRSEIKEHVMTKLRGIRIRDHPQMTSTNLLRPLPI